MKLVRIGTIYGEKESLSFERKPIMGILLAIFNRGLVMMSLTAEILSLIVVKPEEFGNDRFQRSQTAPISSGT